MGESWAAVPTHLMNKPEWRALSNDAKWLWMAARLYAADIESDGLLEDYVLPALMLSARVTTAPDVLFSELVSNGWWEHFDGGWQDVHFLDQNASHDEREHKRILAAARKRKQRLHNLSRVKERQVTRDEADVSRVTKADVTQQEIEEEIHIEAEAQDALTDAYASLTLSQPPSRPEHVQNGAFNAMHDAGRAQRIEEILDGTVSSCRFLTPKAKDRWRGFITQIVVGLAARNEISESLVRRRARDFFLMRECVRLGDSSQARHLREHMLKAVPKSRRHA